MRIRYVIPIDDAKALIISDHWEFPMLGGVCLVREEGGLAKTIEVVFNGRPLGEAPAIEEVSGGEARYSISIRDKLLPFVKNTLNDAKSFLQCYFGIEFLLDDIDVRYEGETSDEEELIPVKSMRVGKHNEPLYLPFDMLTRAIWA
ncbi:MAG TPA: hypothetical protein VGU65_13450 [Frateuria sp.]|uniref:hypothetical protein n=1 Tax=Frateuria sp. TaxID=2211372 RepID=UPI002DE2549F|nr:hypothetical protein [Frateuria sp.]